VVILFFLFFLVFTLPVFATTDIKINSYSSKGSYEWIEIINNSSTSTDLSGWYFKDFDGNIKIINACISANSNIIIDFYQFLNDKLEETLSLYDQQNNLIHKIDTFEIIQKNKPDVTNTCIITPTSAPTNIPTEIPTVVPTITLIPSVTPTTIPTVLPTTDSTIINPTSGISLTEFMPYSSLEWIEIYNDNDKPVELNNWKITDNSTNIKTIENLKILSKNYAIFEFSPMLNNDDSDKVILKNQNNQDVSQYEYPSGKFILERSWSLVGSSWCQAEITKNSSNASSCYSAPTPTKTPTPTTTPTKTPTPTILITPTALPTDKNLYQLDESATASAVFTPTEESGFYTTPAISTTPFASNLVLGVTTTAKKNYLPLIFIVSGGLLLLSPLLFDKLKKK